MKAKIVLNEDLRIARNLAVLTPFQVPTRVRLQQAIVKISYRIRSSRYTLSRLVCYREILVRDNILDKPNSLVAGPLPEAGIQAERPEPVIDKISPSTPLSNTRTNHASARLLHTSLFERPSTAVPATTSSSLGVHEQTISATAANDEVLPHPDVRKLIIALPIFPSDLETP